MTETATTDWFGRWGTSVFSENTAIFVPVFFFFDRLFKLVKITKTIFIS